MVTNTLDATAGSAPARSSPSGTSTPARPATTMLVSIAAAITLPSAPMPSTSVTPMPISTAMVRPFISATRISRHTARQWLEPVSWLVAMARTVTASVWVPALPPTPATIGISAARIASRSIESSKKRMTVDATSAVSRLAASQRTRAL